MARERGGPVARAQFDSQLTPEGAFLIGTADEVVEKIARHSEALGGISRITFQINAGSLPRARMMTAIEGLGTRVAPALHGELALFAEVAIIGNNTSSPAAAAGKLAGQR